MASVYEAAGGGGRTECSPSRTPGTSGASPTGWQRTRSADLDEHAVACFDAALGDVGYAGELREVLHDYFAWATVRMAAHAGTPDTVPDGVSLPHWDWTGLVSH